ncbi:MAG: hypothetical protein P2A85_29510 (plasmid) [Microcoleus anatoxicus]|uniref:hypothetical protein n=1 Tax=Microcoleus anatoxicus TaxID=2705319 RepID=UPI0036708F72
MTRRAWKDNHAAKFIKAFYQNKLVKALDKDIRYGGKQIGWCRLLCAPYKEQLAAMPVWDLQAEGGMCESVEAFIKRYFKGNTSLEVWVIRFEFVGLNQPAPTPTAEALGVYSDSETKADSNSLISSPIESIHQAQLSGFGVCADSAVKTDSNSPITSATESIHQTSLTSLGVYSVIQNTANNNFAVALSTLSIHQASLACLGVYYALEPKTNSNSALTLSTLSIHQASPAHHTSFGVYPSDGNQSDSNATKNSLAESIHQTPVVQGGSGLVYSFWKGESMVNHYRYKVKMNGKWKVKSVYIPVGKLPKVREAIANKLSVATIVVEVLGRKL